MRCRYFLLGGRLQQGYGPPAIRCLRESAYGPPSLALNRRPRNSAAKDVMKPYSLSRAPLNIREI